MSYNLPSDAEESGPPPLPGISETALRRVYRWSVIIGAAALAIVALWLLVQFYTDWLWFSHLGQGAVHLRILAARAALFAGGSLFAGAALTFNLWLAARLGRGPSILAIPSDAARLLRAFTIFGSISAVLIAAPVFGSIAASQWETFILFLNRVPFGVADPQFGLDVMFYVTSLRLLQFLQGWLLGLLLLSVVMALLMYVAVFSQRGVKLILTPRMMKHVAGLGVALLLLLALGHLLDIYELALSRNGAVFGAAYTDVHARIPVLWLLTAIALLGAAGFAASNYLGGHRLMLGAFSLWLLLLIGAHWIYPALFQQFRVNPSEFAREEPYIRRNIAATRAAYGLDAIQESAHQATARLPQAELEANRVTLENVRLWDMPPLLDTYNQLQFMELYYTFLNMDSDRYVVDGQLRQALVAARELEQSNLPPDAHNWINRRLQYTHGYGLAITPGTGFTPGEGRPTFLAQDIPIRGEIPITRPELYYGESTVDYVVVNTAMQEINPLPGDHHYAGTGDVPLSSTLRRLAYAIRFFDLNLALSNEITRDSLLQFRRHAQERVAAIAPFLRLDHDPYPVVDEAGRIWWLLDAYTVTDRYPYSTRDPEGFNYIRNSVKIAIDAYNGDVAFYAADPDDPLLQSWRRAFPGLFREIDEMPADLRAHVRYPMGLFNAQTNQYLRYHVTSPQIFFNRADQWAIPQESRLGETEAPVSATYMLLRLPGQEREEFVQLQPFTPAGEKRNLVGWLIARNDWPHYGELLAFRLPTNRQIDGPSQVEARIENDQQISQQFTLWTGAGSKIIRGHLLVVPVGDSIVYVKPIYLQSATLAFPELKKIIVADGTRLVMADSMEEGLARLVGAPVPPTTGAPPDQALNLQDIENAIQGLQDSLDALRAALEKLRQSSGGGAAP